METRMRCSSRGLFNWQVVSALLMAMMGTAVGDDSPFPIKDRRQATLIVLDPDGKPVVGALVTPRALRARGHGAWRPEIHGEIKTTTTDPQGRTSVDYPATFEGANPVTSVNVLIDHPDFCVTDYILNSTAT